MTWDEYRMECYMLSRYRDALRAEGSFDTRATALIEAGLAFPEEKGIAFLESMLSQDAFYEDMDRQHAPVLLYVGDEICYGVLDGFARSLAAALDRRGYLVELFDPNEDRVSGIAQYAGKRFTAVIGIQTFAFSVKMKDGRNLHDLLLGPKFNMLLDHPVWLKDHLENGPEAYYILTHDENYVRFIEEYYPGIRGTALLPPAGETAPEEEASEGEEKDLPLTFIGSYHDWRAWRAQVLDVNRQTEGIARRFLSYMLHHRDETWEEGLLHTLFLPVLSAHPAAKEAREKKEAFLSLLFTVKPVCFLVMSYLREKILDEIARAKLPLHVYGDSFQGGRYAAAESFQRHGTLTPEESLSVYARSRISLNIMSWHKAGMTERLSHMMLNRAVVVTDESTYLRENYRPGEDYMPFSLAKIDEIPKLLRALLSDPARCERMAESAYEKACEKETWDVRAAKLSTLMEAYRKAQP